MFAFQGSPADATFRNDRGATPTKKGTPIIFQLFDAPLPKKKFRNSPEYGIYLDWAGWPVTTEKVLPEKVLKIRFDNPFELKCGTH